MKNRAWKTVSDPEKRHVSLNWHSKAVCLSLPCGHIWPDGWIRWTTASFRSFTRPASSGRTEYCAPQELIRQHDVAQALAESWTLPARSRRHPPARVVRESKQRSIQLPALI